MEIRDPIHGSISISEETVPIIRNKFFQRLQNIKQLGFANFIFPGATHSRFIHSIGVMFIGEKCFDTLFRHTSQDDDLQRIKRTFKLACLLHDIGHAPLSHTTETVMPDISRLNIPGQVLSTDRQATHEDYSVKAICDSSLTPSFKLTEERYGVQKEQIANLITGNKTDSRYFVLNGIDHFPLLHQLVSGEVDCDRMDYLLRDSYFCGVSYGSYDLDWLINNLEIVTEQDQALLGLSERAIITFNDFLLSRYHMFLMVYFHYKSVCLEQLLKKYFRTSPKEYSIPADIEKYIECNDYQLMKTIQESGNKYARAIVKNQIPIKIYESFNQEQNEVLNDIQLFLENENIEYIKCSSRGKLSRYNTGNEYRVPIKVVRTLYNGKKKLYSDIQEVTNLFQQFKEHHEVTRLHCDIEQLPTTIKKRLLELITVR